MRRFGKEMVGAQENGAPHIGCRRAVPRGVHAALGMAGAVLLLATTSVGCGPPRGSSVSATSGESLYAAYCVQCHGADAANDRGGANPQMRLRRAVALSDKQWREIVLQGRNAMPAFAARLQPQQVDEIARYVRTLSAGR
jgi:mono/diheme cytochrome c family protein